MKEPLVSVIMPVYNGEGFLRVAIDSILNQSYNNFEFIILNDGSTDSTEQIILSYNDKRIKYVKNEINLKLIKTLNKGISLSKGKYIARMDADDISLPTRFEEQIRVFNENSSIDIVSINSLFINENGTKISKNIRPYLSKNMIKYLSPFESIINHPSVMIKSDILKEYKYIDNITVEHIEDFDLWNRLFFNNYSAYIITDPLFLYRINSNSINHSYKEIQQERLFNLSQKYLFQNVGYSISEKNLNYIIGNEYSLSLVYKELNKYLSYMRKNISLSNGEIAEYELWCTIKLLRNFKFILTNSNKIFNKIKSVLFFLKHIHLLINRSFICLILKVNNDTIKARSKTLPF